MATVLPFSALSPAADGFVEALNGHAVGVVTLAFVRRALSAAMADEAHDVATLRALLDEARDGGRLSTIDYETLCTDLARALAEDTPTEWSERVRALPPTAEAPHAEAADLARPGAVLRQRYVLQARLAAGPMSEVFKALDRRALEAGSDDPWVAIKIVGPATAHYAEALQLLQTEAALGQQLQHPHIARVIAFDRDGDYAFIIMEWLEGESLADLLTRQRYQPLSLSRASRILADVGAALAFAHGRGVTHADVKPGNIFLTREGKAKLLDFGIARSAAGLHPAAASEAHTPAYASCEVLEGLAPEAQDDVYSLACVAYRMLAGRRAFGHHDALAAERTGRHPGRIRALGEAQWAALERALAFRRESRTADIPTFLAEFSAPPLLQAQVIVETGVHETLVMPAPPAPRRRIPTARLAAAAAAVLAVTALAIVMRPGSNAPPPAGATPVRVADVVPGAAAPPAATTATAPPASLAAAPPPAREALPARPARAASDEHPARTVSTPISARAAERPEPSRRPARQAAVAPAPDAPAAAAAAVATASATVASGEAATTAGTPAAAPAGAMADTAKESPAAAPDEVPLTTLEFRRYVEPKIRSRSRLPDPPGWVELRFVVGRDGVPRDIRVTGSSPPGRYERAARDAVKRWRFEPVTEGSVTVERHTGVRLRFQSE